MDDLFKLMEARPSTDFLIKVRSVAVMRRCGNTMIVDTRLRANAPPGSSRVSSRSYIELFNEELRDLLNPASIDGIGGGPAAGGGAVVARPWVSPTATDAAFSPRRVVSPQGFAGASAPALRIVDNPIGGPHVKGLVEEVVSTKERVMELLAIGEAQRRVAATHMNARSSRSHTMFKVRAGTMHSWH